MMSKASFMMQDQLRRGYSHITEGISSSAFIVRGRLPFPQGLLAISVLFNNKVPADVYAHRYFVEKQSDPSQPSPQMHITEESQSVIKVMSGLRYMRDDNSKLDNTMYVVTDYDKEAAARQLSYREGDADEKEGDEPASGSSKVTQKGSKRRRMAQMYKNKAEENTSAHEGTQEGESYDAVAEPEIVADTGDRMNDFVASLMKDAGVGGVSSDERKLSAQKAVGAAASAGAVAAAGGGGGGGMGGSLGGVSGGSTPAVQSYTGSVTAFPTADDCVRDKHSSFNYFFNALYASSAQRDVSYYNMGSNKMTLDDRGKQGTDHLFQQLVGGYTVLYNPIEMNELTFTSFVRKLEEEERVVKAIVVPTTHAWRQVQLWADAFPDAEILAAGSIPLYVPGKTVETPETVTGGLQDMGNGVCGFDFPEVDLEAEAAEEQRQQQQKEQLRRGRQEEAVAAAPAPERLQYNTIRSQYHHAHHADTSAAAAMDTQTLTEQEVLREEDPVDILWTNSSAMIDRSNTGREDVGLRARDAARVKLLDEMLADARGAKAPPPLHQATEFVALTPTIELHRVAGDSYTNEYVLYDTRSATLACTDLFHGAYADLDPVNSWMCRVWFKFMKKGNHKRTDLVPRFKWLQVLRQGTLPQVQQFVDTLTRTRRIRALVHAHGTPPVAGVPVAADALREQWGLPTLAEAQAQAQQATAERRSGRETAAQRAEKEKAKVMEVMGFRKR